MQTARRFCRRILSPSNVFEALLWLIFFGLTVLEWIKFREEPTFTTVELEPAELPAFMVCPGSHSNATMLRGRLFQSYGRHLWKHIDRLKYQNISFREIYIDHGLSIEKMLRRKMKDELGSLDDDVAMKTRKGQWMRTFLPSGVCYTYQPRGRQDHKGSPFLGPWFRFNEHPEFTGTSTSTAFQIRFHGTELPYKNQAFFPDKDAPRVVVRQGDSLQLTVKINRYRNPNLRRKPCNDTRGYARSKCLSHCAYQKKVNRLGCVMPWMDIKTKPCIFHTKKIRLAEQLNLTDCRCLPACLEDRLDVTVSQSTMAKRKGITFVIIKFEYLADTRITTVSYSGQHLLSTVGGYIGLLLGTSVLSLTVSCLTALFDKWTRQDNEVHDMFARR